MGLFHLFEDDGKPLKFGDIVFDKWKVMNYKTHVEGDKIIYDELKIHVTLFDQSQSINWNGFETDKTKLEKLQELNELYQKTEIFEISYAYLKAVDINYGKIKDMNVDFLDDGNNEVQKIFIMMAVEVHKTRQELEFEETPPDIIQGTDTEETPDAETAASASSQEKKSFLDKALAYIDEQLGNIDIGF